MAGGDLQGETSRLATVVEEMVSGAAMYGRLFALPISEVTRASCVCVCQARVWLRRYMCSTAKVVVCVGLGKVGNHAGVASLKGSGTSGQSSYCTPGDRFATQ